jgi:hypothetical protein
MYENLKIGGGYGNGEFPAKLLIRDMNNDTGQWYVNESNTPKMEPAKLVSPTGEKASDNNRSAEIALRLQELYDDIEVSMSYADMEYIKRELKAAIAQLHTVR